MTTDLRSALAVWLLSAMSATASAGECPVSAVLVGGNIDLSTGLTTQRRKPMVAYNAADNEYLVAWFDSRNPGNNDIFAQRMSAAGALLGANFPVREFTGSQSDPFVVHNSTTNEYMVTWKTQRGNPGSQFFNNSFGQLVSSAGVLVGTEFHISNGGLEMSVVYNPIENEYMHEARNFAGGGASGIRGQRLSAAGAKLGFNLTIASVGAPAPAGQITFDPTNNRYLATWRDQTDRDLKGRLIRGDGTFHTNPFVISPTFPSSGSAASGAFDPVNNRYLVVYGNFSAGEILGQLVSSEGVGIGSELTLVTGLTNSRVPFICYSPADAVFFMVWRDSTSGDINGMVLRPDGTPGGSTLTIAAGTPGGNPRLDYNSTTGEFCVVWSDDRNIGEGEQDIYAQLVALTTGTCETVHPDAFNVIFGEYQSGAASDLHESDDSYVTVGQRAALSVLLPVIRLEAEGTASGDSASTIAAKIETAATSIPTQPLQKLSLFDYDANAFEIVDEQLSMLTDTVVEVTIDTNASRFIETGTGAVEMRLDWFDPGDVFFPAWGTRTDQAIWNVTP